jgi:Ca-activated chloride channel family protein
MATGSALYVALQTLFPDEGIDLESLLFKGAWSRSNQQGNSLDASPSLPRRSSAGRAGSYGQA